MCECGCGEPAPIAKQTRKIIGHIKGQPVRFIHGHHAWKRGWTYSNGSILLYENGLRVFEHRKIAAKVLGKPLPLGVLVHHHDGNRANNSNRNLVICENTAYHNLLHRRKRAYDFCGNANWRRCSYCKQHDDPKNLYIHPDGRTARHRECFNRRKRELSGGQDGRIAG